MIEINIPAILKERGIRPNKKLGQNFLVDDFHLREIVRHAQVGPDDEVLEIGAGLGSLSVFLAKEAQRLVAVEMDSILIPILLEHLQTFENVEIVEGDILSLDIAAYFTDKGYLVVANIPYYLTSKLIRHLLEQAVKPKLIALTIQKEVAQRACAKAPNMSLLSLSVQSYGTARIAHQIPAGAFHPLPKVDSALLLIDIDQKAKMSSELNGKMFSLAKVAFQQKRKTLANSLASLPDMSKQGAVEILTAAEIDPRRRPQTLHLEDWMRLAANLDNLS